METIIMVIVLATGLFALLRALPVLTNQRPRDPVLGGSGRLQPARARVPARRRS